MYYYFPDGVNNELAQRFKRSPQYYDCGPQGPPPPPPPPFWPPPPPPPYWRHHNPPPNVAGWEYQQPQNQAYSNAESNVSSGGENANGGAISAAPCTTCGGNGSNAVSNAKSETGQAVAVAIARASTH